MTQGEAIVSMSEFRHLKGWSLVYESTKYICTLVQAEPWPEKSSNFEVVATLEPVFAEVPHLKMPATYFEILSG